MADIIQMRGDIESNWFYKNPILSDRELAFTTDSIPVKMKIGDGYRKWSELNYFAGLKGADGTSSSIAIGTVTTGEPNTPVTVTNSGTSSNVILNFSIPKGEAGQSGSGTGDMLKSVYDTNNNGKVDSIDDNSVTDNVIGDRTLTDGTILTSYTGKLTTLLTGLLSMQKLLTGKTDGKTAPVTNLEKLWNLPWVQGVIITNPADNYSLSSFPLARNGTMKTMDFYVTGTVASATTITVKQNNNVIGTVSISVTGKTTLTFATAVTGTLDDLFSWSVAGAGLSACTVVCNGKWVNR